MSNFLELAGLGRIGFAPYAVINGEKSSGEKIREEKGRNACTLLAWKKEGVFLDELFFTRENEGLLCKRRFQNLSGKSLPLNELGITFSGITFGLEGKKDFFYHNENPRIYEVMTFPIDYKRTAEDAQDTAFDIQAGNRWADPGVVHERIGYSPYQPFPAILVGNYDTPLALVHGTLSQRVFFHNYLLSHDEKGMILMELFSSFKGTHTREVAPGEILEDEWYMGATQEGDKIDAIFAGYTAVLRKKLPPLYGSRKINRDNMTWGSWNDGIFRSVNEKLVLDEAKFVKEHFPTVHHIQLDDGYNTAFPKGPAHGLGVPYEGDEGVDPAKFPEGLKALTDKIRLLGLHPAIWIGGFCPVGSLISREHPEWFIDYSYRVKVSRPLDVSQEAVRDYMCSAIDKLIREYGFDSVKLDFWSYAFEDSHDLYKNRTRSGYEWRSWWLRELRKRLAPNGYLQTGCDIVMGNPFLGEYFTNYRYGIDVGAGNWDWVKTNFAWGVACFTTHTGDLIVPNSDSVGLLPDLDETDALFNINYCLVTHTMVELSGELSKKITPERLAILKKATCNPNNGQEIWTAGWDYRNHREKTPSILYFKTPHFSPEAEQKGLPLRTVGLFNLDETAKTISFTAKDLELEENKNYILKDIWSGEEFPFPAGKNCSFTLPVHGSRVMGICEDEGYQLLDADIRISKAEAGENSLTLTFDYGRKALFSFNKPPKAVFMGEEEFPLNEGKKELSLDVQEKSRIRFIF